MEQPFSRACPYLAKLSAICWNCCRDRLNATIRSARAFAPSRPPLRRPRCGLPNLRTIGHRGQGVDARSVPDAMTACCGIVPASEQTGANHTRARWTPSRDREQNQRHDQENEADPSHPPLKPATRLVTGGRDPAANHGFVNPPVYHVSTVLYPTAEDFLARRARYLYGRRGTPDLGGARKRAARAGGPRIAPAWRCCPRGSRPFRPRCSSVLEAGDHLLVTDSVYQPTRKFCDGVLKRYGITTTYYDPLIGAGIAALIQPQHARGIRRGAGLAVVRDAGRAGDRGRRPRQRRGRADGQYLGEPALFPRLRQGRRSLDPGRHQIYRRPFRRDARHRVGQRGDLGAAERHRARAGPLRRPGRHLSRPARAAHHGRAAGAASSGGTARSRAGSSERPEIARVLHPALESCPGHAIWQRDFSGACGPVQRRAQAGRRQQRCMRSSTS